MKEKIVLSARDLRNEQTPAEKILWERLRNRRFLSKKFIRQHPIRFKIEGRERFFVADFFCFERKLIIEVDGDIHLNQKENDQYRDLIINELGFQVIRVTNRTIEKDLDCFLTNILYPILN